MKIKQVIHGSRLAQAEEIRPFWGFSYWEEGTMLAVCYPIPLNWIVAIARNVYWKFMVAPDKKRGELNKAYNEGYLRGAVEGCREAREKLKSLKKESGQALVELALTITILLVLLSGAVEFGMAFFQFVQLRDAAQEGAQYGSYCQDLGKVTTRARGASNSPINLDTEAQVLVQNEGVEGGGIEVTMYYDHKVFMPFLSAVIGDSITLNATVTNTILQVNSVCP